MTAGILTPAVLDWADRIKPSAWVAGSPLSWGDAVPANLPDTLAVLHARYHGGTALPAAVPRVSPIWWQALCREWVDPRLREHPA